MKKFNLFTAIFAIASIVFFAGCDDNDKKDSNNPPAEECKCDDGTACPEAGKDACVKPEADKCNPACPEGKECKCVEGACDCADVNSPAPVCDPVCKEDEDCIMSQDGKPECRAKDAKPEVCKCDDGKDCPEGDKAKCVADAPANPCDGKNAGDECGENKTCQTEAEALVCKDAPTE